MTTGLQRRLLVLLLVPLLLLAALNTWYDLRSADSATLQQDRQLRSLIPLLADSLVSRSDEASEAPILLMVPAVEEFLGARPGLAAFAVVDDKGMVLFGDAWLSVNPAESTDMEFFSEEHDGTTFRIASQSVKLASGPLVVRLADGSDPRQQWLRLLWFKAILPNLVLVIGAFFAVNWAVRRALRPLLELADAVERRSPHDLSALDPMASPDEVRPLVTSLNRLLGLVNAQSENQRRFVADAAHQLRTPLAALQSQVEAWAMSVETPAQQAKSAITIGADQVLRLRHAVRRTSQLANQLLALSRADAYTAEAQPMQRVNLQTLCEWMLEAFLDAAAVKGVDLGLDAVAVHVSGHDWLLREMLGNLLDNAIKYTPAGGHVTLRCGIRSGTDGGPLIAYMEVEDDGPSIALAERERVLERFYRLSGTQIEGNGLGLAIAAEIARVHQSKLQLGTGASGCGLCVSMCFPD